MYQVTWHYSYYFLVKKCDKVELKDSMHFMVINYLVILFEKDALVRINLK